MPRPSWLTYCTPRYGLCRGCGRPSKRSRCSTCQGKRHRATYTWRERMRRKAVVDRWRATHGEYCPGWGEPPHATSRQNPLTADHEHAVGAGGDEGGPLVVLCRRCNGRKAHRTEPTRSAPGPSCQW